MELVTNLVMASYNFWQDSRTCSSYTIKDAVLVTYYHHGLQTANSNQCLQSHQKIIWWWLTTTKMMVYRQQSVSPNPPTIIWWWLTTTKMMVSRQQSMSSNPPTNHLMVTYNHQSQPAMLHVTYYHIQGGWLTTTTRANAKTSQNSVKFPNQSRVD